MFPSTRSRLLVFPVLAISASICLIPSCGEDSNPQAPNGSQPPVSWVSVRDTLFYTSFESPADTIGWTGFGSMRFSDDVPSGCGEHSLRISGCCLMPHARLRLGSPPVESGYIVQGWSKAVTIGGAVLLRASGDRLTVGFSVLDSTWTFYRSDTLDCPAGDSLAIELCAGGFVARPFLADALEVIRVE